MLKNVLESVRRPGERFAAACSGSAGIFGSGIFSKRNIRACSWLRRNRFRAHPAEKRVRSGGVPWIDNARNTDLAVAVDKEDRLHRLRLFGEPEGKRYLEAFPGLNLLLVERLPKIGPSGAIALMSCIKAANYFEYTKSDIILTVLTDSAVFHKGRLRELAAQEGEYSLTDARGGTSATPSPSHHRLSGRTHPCRTPAHPQPEILRQGGAAGTDRRRAERPPER